MNNPVIVPPRKSLTRRQRVDLFDKHKGICVVCSLKIHAGEPWIAEHINPRAISADDSATNLGPAHTECARNKTKADQRDIAKVIRIRAKHLGIGKRKGRRLPGGRDSGLKKRMDGTVVDRRTGKVAKVRS